MLDVRGPECFCQPFCSLWISTVLVCVCVCVGGGGGGWLSKVVNTAISRKMCYVCRINMHFHKMLYFISIRSILQPFF